MIKRGYIAKWAGLCATLGMLGACTVTQTASVAPNSVVAPPQTNFVTPSRDSLALGRYYQAAQDRLLAQGLLRQDGGGLDTRYTAQMLADNFERIALYDEYALRGGRFVASQTPSRLRRWDKPVAMKAIFGSATPADQRSADAKALASYANRLSRITQLPIQMTTGPANYHVLFMNADELKAAGPTLQQLVPGLDRAALNSITRMDRNTFCSVYAFSDRASPDTYIAAIAVIKTEHPNLLRLSCIHEEIAQGLGLANDSPNARPSIFNDDEEFALLTTHDEQLLAMLYDPRLRPGMTPAQARPIVTQLAIERLGGSS